MSVFDHSRRRRARLVNGLAALAVLVAPTAAANAEEQTACTLLGGQEATSPAVMEVRLAGDVGPDMAHRLFAELDTHLATYPTLKTIKILLSSSGGFIESGVMIHNYLRGLHQRLALEVITHNIGSVQSAAVDVYCAGNQRLASPYTYFMVHDIYFELEEDTYDTKAVSDLGEETVIAGEAGYALFSACTNLTVTEVGAMFEDQTYIGLDRALELGLTHSIQPATFDRGVDIRCLIESESAERGVDEE